MKKLRNPFAGLEGYNCFGCSPDNHSGLRLTFTEEGDEIVSVWTPHKSFQGYKNVLHGGIQATLLDEIASWVVYVKLKTAGMTSRLNVRYHKTVFADEGSLTLRARVREMRRNLADIDARLYNSQGVLCTDASVIYFTLTPERSRNELYYPAHEEFFPRTPKPEEEG
jgi:uncharacterized protein (TIGR00369 family)